MKHDLRNYETVSEFVDAVRADKSALRALDEAALSGELSMMRKVRDVMSALKLQHLPTA